MTPKRRRFVEAYVGRAKGNASEAARIAGYADAGTEGWRLLQNAEIQRAVEQRLKRALKRLSVDDLVKILEDHAECNAADYIVMAEPCAECKRYAPSFDIEKLRDDGYGHLIQEMRFNQKTGEVTIKVQPVGPAIDKLLKVAGAYKADNTDESSLASILAQALRGTEESDGEVTH